MANIKNIDNLQAYSSIFRGISKGNGALFTPPATMVFIKGSNNSMITTRITFFLEVADLKIVLSVYNTYVI